MESLPIDILETIFSLLPSISTLRCKLVCKTWGSVIGKSKNKVGRLYALTGKNGEVELHYDDCLDKVKLEKYDSGEKLMYGYYYKPVSLQKLVFSNEIVGSCNGLVCFFSNKSFVGYPTFIICNPVNGEFVFLPKNKRLRKECRDPVGGFGYVKSANEYKVVGIYYNPFDGKTCAHVYTLGSQVGWRIISNEIPYKFWISGIFVNGAIHLVHQSDGDSEFVAFDLEDERFKSVPSVPCDEAGHPIFALLGGNLCVVFHCSNMIDIWALKKKVDEVSLPAKKMKGQYYDGTWSWSREFKIDCESPWYDPFVITDSNEVLLWHYDSEGVYCYDPNTSTLNKSSNAYPETYCLCHEIIPHMNTLISLKDLGEPLGRDWSSAHKKFFQEFIIPWREKNNKTEADAFVPAVASGMICCDSLWGMPAAILSLAKVNPPMCMKFISSATNDKIDVFLQG